MYRFFSETAKTTFYTVASTGVAVAAQTVVEGLHSAVTKLKGSTNEPQAKRQFISEVENLPISYATLSGRNTR